MKQLRVAVASALLVMGAAAQADVTVGVIVGATGPGASLGIPYKNAFSVMPKTLGGEKVEYIILDDGSDPSNSVKNARKLITENKVDMIIGPGTTPTAMSVVEVAGELKVPQLALSPLPPAAMKAQWTFNVPQPQSIMMKAVVDHMKAKGIKTVGFIGFSDPWGDLVHTGLSSNAEAAGIKVVTNERYNRTDTSVAGQVLKVIAANPDAVVIGGSGTPGALPHTTLVERGFKKPIYHNPAVINKDFLRVGGKAVEGALAPTGPVIVAEQLPDSNPIKKVSQHFITAYEAAYGAGSRNAFAAYSWDAYLIADRAVATAKKTAKPGTAEFRSAIRDALETTKELVGTHAVYTMSPTNHNGVDSRGAVMVTVQQGEWKLVQ